MYYLYFINPLILCFHHLKLFIINYYLIYTNLPYFHFKFFFKQKMKIYFIAILLNESYSFIQSPPLQIHLLNIHFLHLMLKLLYYHFYFNCLKIIHFFIMEYSMNLLHFLYIMDLLKMIFLFQNTFNLIFFHFNYSISYNLNFKI